MKRAQMTVLLIVGIVLLIGAVFFYMRLQTESIDDPSPGSQSVFAYMQECIHEHALIAIQEEGLEQGALEAYMDAHIPSCAELQYPGIDIHHQDPSTHVDVKTQEVYFDIDFPVTLEGKTTTAKQDFSYTFPLKKSAPLGYAVLSTPDRLMSMDLSAVSAQDSYGNPVNDVDVTIGPNTDEDILGEVIYSLGPSSTEFTPSLELDFDYEGLGGSAVTLAYEDKGLWKAIPCLDNPGEEQLHCFLDHFSDYGVHGTCGGSGGKVFIDTQVIEITEEDQVITFDVIFPQDDEDKLCINALDLVDLQINGTLHEIRIRDQQGNTVKSFGVSRSGEDTCVLPEGSIPLDIWESLSAGLNTVVIVASPPSCCDTGKIRAVFSLQGEEGMHCGENDNEAVLVTDESKGVVCRDEMPQDRLCDDPVQIEDGVTYTDFSITRSGNVKAYAAPITDTLEIDSSSGLDEIPTIPDFLPGEGETMPVAGFKKTDTGTYMSAAGFLPNSRDVIWIEIGDGWQWAGQEPDFDQYWATRTGDARVYIVDAEKHFDIQPSDLAVLADSADSSGPQPPQTMGVAHLREVDGRQLAAVGTVFDDIDYIQWIEIGDGWQLSEVRTQEPEWYCTAQTKPYSCEEAGTLLGCFCGKKTQDDIDEKKAVACGPHESHECAKSVPDQPTQKPASRDIQFIMDAMTLEQKVGQLIMSTPAGEAYGNYYLFKEQINTFADNAPDPVVVEGIEIYPLVATDGEGGRVDRGLGDFSSARSLSGQETADIQAYGSRLASSLRDRNLNMNLAPVLDISSSGLMAVQERSISEDPQRVVEVARILIQEMHDQDIVVTGKHFPGYGNRESNTDRELTRDPRTLGGLEDDMVPYGELDLDVIMMNSIIYENIDPLPAVLSSRFSEEARRKAPDALLITDDIVALSDQDFMSFEDMVIGAIGNVDMLLFASSSKASTAHAHIINAVNEGAIDQSMIDEKVQRVLELKSRYGLVEWETLPRETEDESTADDSVVQSRSVKASIDSYLAKKGIDSCYYSVSLKEMNSGTVLQARPDEPIHMMSTFKGPLSAFYYMVVPPEEWDSAAEDMQLMLMNSDNYATTRIFRRIDEAMDSRVLEGFNLFLHGNGMSDAIVTEWNYPVSGYNVGTYGQAKNCGGDMCNKVASADEFAEFYRRLYMLELTYDGKTITSAQREMILQQMEKEASFGWALTGNFDVEGQEKYYTKGGLHAHPPNPWQHNVYADAGIIKAQQGVYAAAVMAMDCGGSSGTFGTMHALARILAEEIGSEANT